MLCCCFSFFSSSWIPRYRNRSEQPEVQIPLWICILICSCLFLTMKRKSLYPYFNLISLKWVFKIHNGFLWPANGKGIYLKASGGKKTNILDIFALVLKLSGSKNSFKICSLPRSASSLILSRIVLEAKCRHPLSQLLSFPRSVYIPGDPECESGPGP